MTDIQNFMNTRSSESTARRSESTFGTALKAQEVHWDSAGSTQDCPKSAESTSGTICR